VTSRSVVKCWVRSSGLGLDGRSAVQRVLRSILAEFDLTLALSGRTSRGSSVETTCTR
jgi:hypothetical protein